MPATLTSILGTDLITNSRAVINTNFDNLNTTKADLTSPSLLGIPIAPTAAYQTATTQLATTNFVNQALSSVVSAATQLTTIPIPQGGVAGTTAVTVLSSVMQIGQVVNPFQITANKITFQVSGSVAAAGSVDLTLYNESGASSVFTVTTSAAIGSSNQIVETALGGVLVPAGNYWIAINANAPTGFNVNTWSDLVPVGYLSSVASKAVTRGTLAIVAGTPPTSITPTAITAAASKTLIFRLDN